MPWKAIIIFSNNVLQFSLILCNLIWGQMLFFQGNVNSISLYVYFKSSNVSLNYGWSFSIVLIWYKYKNEVNIIYGCCKYNTFYYLVQAGTSPPPFIYALCYFRSKCIDFSIIVYWKNFLDFHKEQVYFYSTKFRILASN